MGEPVAVPPPEVTANPEVVKVCWKDLSAYCGVKVVIQGEALNYPADKELAGTVLDKDTSETVAEFKVNAATKQFHHEWTFVDLLPRKSGSDFLDKRNLIVKVEGKETPDPLVAHFIPNLNKQPYSSGRHHFELAAKNYVAELSSNLDFIKGWGGSVVKLGAAAPAGTNGLITGFHYAGYRWLKQDGTTHKFWDGTAWQPLPTGFVLRDGNNFCVGFYKDGTAFRSQYDGVWPESFTDYSLSDPSNQAKLTAWKDNIEQTWSSANSKLGIRRAGCPSTKKECCRYEVKTSVVFNEKTSFTRGLLVVADGNIRSNDQLWFLGEPRVAVAAHEFGHHIGNPDEYAGAVVDTSLNDDGATNGIDSNSIMGQQLTKVKKRHYRTICKHMAALVQNQICQTYTYEPVDL